MCLYIPAYSQQSGPLKARLVPWLRPILLFVLPLVLAQIGFAQGQDKTKIRTIDMRGQDPLMASAKSIVESRNNVVVVLIRGGGQELIEKTKGQLKALAHKGYDRLGVVLCDLNPGESGMPVLAVVSDGTIYAVIKKAKPDSTTMWEIYNLVNDAYQEHILPKINDGQNVKN